MPETHSHSSPANAEPLHYVVVDQSFDADQAARDAANERLTAELNEGGRFKRLIGSIWKGGAFKEYYKTKYKREALGEIERSENVLLYQADEQQATRAKQVTIDRFQLENEDAIHTEAGEHRLDIPEAEPFASSIKELVRKSIEEGWSNEQLLQERTRVLNVYGDAHGDAAAGKGRVRADNILQIADAVKGAIDHGESIESVIANMRITVGESRSGVRTEARYNKVERIADKLASSRIGSLVGPELVVSAVTFAACVAGMGSKSVVGAATKAIVPGVAAGLWAGLRENKRMKDDRTQHSREMAQGQKIRDDSERRQEMEETRYETRTAAGLTASLDSLFSEDAEYANAGAIEAALGALAEVESRIKLSDKGKIDLISYSNPGAVEEERLALDIARATAKVMARTRLEPALREMLGLADDDNVIEARIEATDTQLEADMSARDRLFDKIKRRHVAEAAAKGALLGATIGLGVQELAAALSGSQIGLVEQAWSASNHGANGTDHQTLLESIVHGTDDHDVVTHHAASGNYSSNSLANFPNSQFDLSDDHTLLDNGNGTFDLVDANGTVTIDNLQVEPDGSLSQQSIDMLTAKGMRVDDLSKLIDVPTQKTLDVDVNQFVQNHIDETTHVTRDLWYDNNTPRIFDKNELGLHWGGDAGISHSGGFDMSIATMTEDGSFHGGDSASWLSEARQENLKLAVSASRGNQTDVFMVDIKPDGSIYIPEDSPAAQFFANENGHAVFHGAYAEVVQLNEVDADGVQHISPLATLVGENDVGTIQDTVITNVEELRPKYVITTDGYDTTEHIDVVTDTPPVIPIVPRRPLEKLAHRGVDSYYGYGYEGDGDISEAEVIKMVNERSPRLTSDPEAVLNPREELSWYQGELLKRRGVDGFAQLEQAVDNSTELSSMLGGVESIVTIPVAAAQEADTIYGTLSLYGRQGADSLQKSLVMLNLNWLDTAMADLTKKSSIEKARQEIDRARRDFPNLKIAVIENEYSSERAQETGGVIGYVAADLVDAALLAIRKRIESGDMDADHEVLIIRNDADPEGMSEKYLEQYQKAMHNPKYENLDVFKGITRFGVKWAEKYPGFAVASNFAAALSAGLSSRGLPATGGANFAIKASTLAAVGGLGVMSRTGAGSDDGALGRRIRLARWGVGVIPRDAISQSSVLPNGKTVPYRAVAANVFGATVDTNPSRLIPYYIQGVPYSNAWGSDFSSGDGGYRERAAGMMVTPEGKSEIANDWDMQFSGIESAITSELRWNGVEESRRTLSVFFGHVPGSYVVTGAGAGDGDESYHHNVQFKLTNTGKEYLKKRFKREGYGKKLRLNQYRDTVARGGRSPLVSPL